MFEVGRSAWPQFALGWEIFESYFASAARSPVALGEANAADMYLACACICRDQRALLVLEQLLTRDVARVVASIDASPGFVEEVLGLTRAQLLGRGGSEPGKLARYGGRASLKGWVCAIAARSAIGARRQREGPPHLRSHPREEEWAARAGPEFNQLRDRYNEACDEAVRRAIERLSVKQRMLLRLHFAQRMSIDELAAAYGVARSTAARWVARARQELLEETRRHLGDKVHVTSTERTSFARDMSSRLDTTLLRILDKGNLRD
jgi:RNA polymerase sigma-70 factor (ECF subfamily)